jgi:hypothetical protein
MSLKKVLIFTYYFPPSNQTASNRTKSWVMYCKENGWYPIVITRDWSNGDKNEYVKSTNQNVVIERNDTHEVHYVPYKGNFRTNKLNGGSLKIIRKIFTVIELVFQNMFGFLLPYKNMFNYAHDFVIKQKPDAVLISGAPFPLFKLGYELNKKYKLPWFADYRDGWTCGNYGSEGKQNIIEKLSQKANLKYEQKWLSTCTLFFTVSKHLTSLIQQSINKKGEVIYNGFFPMEKKNQELSERSNSSVFQILYSGEIYSKQPYAEFIEICKALISHYKNKINIEVLFLGTNSSNHKIPESLIAGFEDAIKITNRLPLAEAVAIQQNVDAFIMLSHDGMKGITSSKLFDYLNAGKPIVLFPNDNDVLEELTTHANLGKIANDEKALKQQLINLIEEKLATGKVAAAPNIEYIQSFNRQEQAALMYNAMATAIEQPK